MQGVQLNKRLSIMQVLKNSTQQVVTCITRVYTVHAYIVQYIQHLIHDHVLSPLVLLTLPSFHHSLQELQELDVPFLLNAVDEVLHFRLQIGRAHV